MESAYYNLNWIPPTSYYNLNWIPPTSNMVERLFSHCKLVLTDLRSSIGPVTFEEVMFLKINEEFWNEENVQTALHKMNKRRKTGNI